VQAGEAGNSGAANAPARNKNNMAHGSEESWTSGAKVDVECGRRNRDMKRRDLLQKAGLAAGAMAIPKWTSAGRTPKLDCVFQLSVITDEISQDFEHALTVAANEFGVGFVEIRGLWKKYIVNLDEKEGAEAKRLLAKYDLKVTDIASPLFKVDWQGAPKSKYSPTGSAYNASFTFEQQDEVL